MKFQGKNKVFVDGIKITKAWFSSKGCTYHVYVSMYHDDGEREYTHAGDVFIICETSWMRETVHVTDVDDECPQKLLDYLRKDFKKVILSIQKNLEKFLRQENVNPIEVAKNNMEYVEFPVKSFLPNIYVKMKDKRINVNNYLVKA